jgi:zinc D-Ala-D-Ala carboxypeptidase
VLPSAALESLGISESLIAARGLQSFAEAENLELAEVGTDGREHFLIPDAAVAWHSMKRDARRDGIVLSIISAFRSVDRQIEIVRRKLQAGEPLEQILRVSAPPGFSEHHSGRAVDLTTPLVPTLDIGFAESEAFQWLLRHANGFRFFLSYPENNAQGYSFEPWHWCYRSAA